MTMYTSGSGTLSYAAPERLKDMQTGYNHKVDIWSAGLLLVMLLTGEHPFSDYLNGSSAILIQ
jgi:serine/threonine protein kinase